MAGWLRRAGGKVRHLRAQRREAGKQRRRLNQRTIERLILHSYGRELARLGLSGENMAPAEQRRFIAAMEERSKTAIRGITINYALGRIGITNRGEDRKKRQRIRKLLDDMHRRIALIEPTGKGTIKSDAPLKWIRGELEKELGGRRRYLKFRRLQSKGLQEVEKNC